MKRKYIKIPVICLTIALASCSLYGCAKNNSSQANTSSTKSDSKADDDSDNDAYTEEAVKANAEVTPTKEYTDEELSEEYDEDESVAITFNGESAKADSDYVLVEDGKVTIKKSGTYVLSGDYKGQVVVDSDDEDLVRIVLSNTNIESENSSAIFVKKASEVILTIKDGTENTISDAEKYSEDAENNKEKAAIYSKDDLTINGKGSLSVNGNYNHGIQSKDNLIIVSGDINIKSKGNSIVGKDCVVIKDGNIVIDSQGKGIKATSTKAEKGYVYIQGGTINITAEDDGIHSDTDVIIDDGDITISSGDDGIHADIKVLINNGTIKIDDSYEGIESTIITMNDGDVTVNSSDDGINASNGLSSGEMEGGPGVFGGMNGGERPTGDFQDGEMPDGEKPDGKMQDFNDNQKKNNDSTDSESEDDTDKQALDTLDMVFEMNGGKLYVNAGGDGLDSNGDVVMNGGTVTIDGPEDDGNGALDYNSSYKMNGGTLIAAGSSGMSMTPSEGQNSVNVYLDNTYSDTNIVIKDSQGNELVNYTPAKKFSSFVYSGSNLTTGETYTVYANGEQVETFTVNDTVTKAGNESAGRGSFGPQGGKMQKDVTANKQS